MSDFQKQTLKRWARNFLIVCGFGLLVYGMVKSTFVLGAAVAVIVGGYAWSMISSIRWDWRLRGKLTEDEYKAYQACNRWFGFTTDKYLPTEDQIQEMMDTTSIDSDILWSMFEKLS